MWKKHDALPLTNNKKAISTRALRVICLISDTLVNIHFVYDRLDRAQPHAALRPRPLGGAWGRRGPNPPLRPRSGSVTQYLRSAPTPPYVRSLPQPQAYCLSL